ncbi:MAG: BNR repeat-containing protein [Candidatus Marinimicrobia bacterium]|nr:BNR repeat-containing protein [Candidatus Neomarinimicrobiota bacterium]
MDNHCGAALAATGGLVHAVIGAHHGRLGHCRFDPAAPDRGWTALGEVGSGGTYPSLVADAEGNLHLAYRARDKPWALHYCRWEAASQSWIAPRSLVLADKTGYVYWTNGLTVGDDGAVHLVFGNTHQSADGSLYYGVSQMD